MTPPLSPPDPGLLSTFVSQHRLQIRAASALWSFMPGGSEQSVNDRSVRLIVKGQNTPASQRSQWARNDTPLFSSENHHFGYADAQIMNTYSSSGECTHVTTCHSTGVRKRARAPGCVLPPRLPPLHAKCGIGSQATLVPTPEKPMELGPSPFPRET